MNRSLNSSSERFLLGAYVKRKSGWRTSYAQALKQCRAVELRAATASERVGEPRVSGSVTAGKSDAKFEAWLVAQGAGLCRKSVAAG